MPDIKDWRGSLDSRPGSSTNSDPERSGGKNSAGDGDAWKGDDDNRPTSSTSPIPGQYIPVDGGKFPE